MVRILSESGHERNRNAGDEAYFETMVDLFQKTLKTVEIKAFSDRPEHDKKRYDIQTIYSGGTLKRSFQSIFEIIKAIKWCDVYVWGAGQILRDDNFILSPPYRLSRPLIAKLMGKPVMAYGVGIGPLETKTVRFMARHILNRFDLITYRDNTSGEILKSLKLVKPAIKATVDPAFGLKPADDNAIDQLMDKLKISKKSRLLALHHLAPYIGVHSRASGIFYRLNFRLIMIFGKKAVKNNISVILKCWRKHLTPLFENIVSSWCLSFRMLQAKVWMIKSVRTLLNICSLRGIYLS